MVDYNDKIKLFENMFGNMESEELITEIKSFLENDLDFETKSKAASLIGSIICYLSPYLEEDSGYFYFKKALELNSDNYDAMLGICSIFNTYPYPFNNIVTEMEYLMYAEKLIENFENLNDDQRINVLQSFKSYTLFRKKIIEKFDISLETR